MDELERVVYHERVIAAALALSLESAGAVGYDFRYDSQGRLIAVPWQRAGGERIRGREFIVRDEGEGYDFRFELESRLYAN